MGRRSTNFCESIATGFGYGNHWILGMELAPQLMEITGFGNQDEKPSSCATVFFFLVLILWSVVLPVGGPGGYAR